MSEGNEEPVTKTEQAIEETQLWYYSPWNVEFQRYHYMGLVCTRCIEKRQGAPCLFPGAVSVSGPLGGQCLLCGKKGYGSNSLNKSVP